MKALRTICCWLVLVTIASAGAPKTFTDDECAAIQPFIDKLVGKTNSALVVGLVDEQGSRVFSAGKLDNGTSREVDGDSLFFIGSLSKTFTALLLLDAVERGEVKLDDPVAKYLPSSVNVPSYEGRDITLVDLATHTSALPTDPNNMTGADTKEEYETYTVEQMYAFLSGCKLTRKPGTEYEYSNVGMALLGHALSRAAGTDFESLVVERICRPLDMNSTCVAPTTAMQKRLAMGHGDHGNSTPPWQLQAYAPAGAVHSTVNDLLKYAAAQADLTKSKLSPSIALSHVIRYEDTHGLPSAGSRFYLGRTAMDWVDHSAVQPPGMELLGHAGGAGSYHSWAGFDTKQRRGVVVLTTANDFSVEAVGWTLLQRMPLTADSARDFAHEMVGIGTALDLDGKTHSLRITKVFANSPAAQAGLSAGLVIQKIDGVATTGKDLAECVSLIRGPAGTKVRLELVGEEQTDTKSVEVTRQKFVISG